MILNNSVTEGDALPSVRQIAADLSVNPLTVTRAYDTLVESGAVEKRRGLGMFVAQGARDILLAQERRSFMQEEWPRIAQRITALGLDADTLIDSINHQPQKDIGDDQ